MIKTNIELELRNKLIKLAFLQLKKVIINNFKEDDYWLKVLDGSKNIINTIKQ